MMKFLLIAFALTACFSYGVGYREGLRVVWTYETLGKCNGEGGILP